MQLFNLLFFTTSAILAENFHNDWNSNINWVDNSDVSAFENQVKESGKYGMMVIHKSWCGACKALKPNFSSSENIEKLSENFIMFNALDEQEPSDQSYQPDGGYIPIILFVDPKTGKVDAKLKNQGRSDYQYFYSSSAEIVKSMEKILEGQKKEEL